VLTYHVVPGAAVFAADLVPGQVFPSLLSGPTGELQVRARAYTPATAQAVQPPAAVPPIVRCCWGGNANGSSSNHDISHHPPHHALLDRPTPLQYQPSAAGEPELLTTSGQMAGIIATDLAAGAAVVHLIDEVKSRQKLTGNQHSPNSCGAARGPASQWAAALSWSCCFD
jgi:hypothetical protein